MTKRISTIALIAIVVFLGTYSGAILAETGMAVYYSDKFQGRKTASGDVFDQNQLTAAHKKFPFGTRIKVTNLENDRSVIVKINDRMASKNSNIIDITRRAAKELDFVKQGKTRVSLEEVD
ncbi:MAG: septal ring lytic transglycosylase RlpA family protein [Nitrosomonas sp.]|nr:septal ring lytic transglycosylase RlpA family protein [Nitrosomonas sp.]